MDKTRRTFLLTVMVGIGFLSISFTAPLHAAGEDDVTDKDHDTSTESTSSAPKVADTIKNGEGDKSARKADAKPAPKTDAKKEADAKTSENRKLSQERIRTEFNELNDPGLLKLWSSLTSLEDLDLAKFKELVLSMPATNADKKKDEDKKEKLIKLFEKEKEFLGTSPLKEFQRVAAEIVNDRFKKITETTPPPPGAAPTQVPPGAGADKAKADADKKAAEEAAKLAASKKGEDAKKADELAKQLALDPQAAERKALGDALKNALGQAGKGEGEGQGSGAGSGSGSGDSGKGGGEGSGGGGDSPSKELAKNDTPPKKNENKPNTNTSSNNGPTLPESTPKPTAKDEKKEPLFADSKPEPKKTPTPEAEASPSTPPTTPQVADAGFKPGSGPGSSRKPGSLGQGSAGQVINGGSLPGGADGSGGPGGPGDNGGAGKVQSAGNGGGGNSLDPSYLNSIRGAVPRDPGPTTTGYNMIKVAPGEWQAADGGGASEVYGLEGNNDNDDGGSKRRAVTYASSSPVGFPSPEGRSARTPSSTGRGAVMEADGVFKKRDEWAGGGLCQGSVRNLIGPCGKVSEKAGDKRT